MPPRPVAPGSNTCVQQLQRYTACIYLASGY
uniref:Uncharacterized protein n=1 Tax=Anguilla anguilla TaxID=7936 RepID=A0A0E9W8J9_ANGAN